jgi:hypothetical protein
MRGCDPTPTLVDLRVAHKDWPRATADELRICREGGRRCPRCQAMMDAGVNPYTMEPLER